MQSLPRYLAYGVTGFPLATLGIPLFVFLPAFYAEQLGLSIATVGVIFLIARLFDVFTDPLIGILSDRSNNVLLRRKLPIALGAPLLLIGIEYLFRPPQSTGTTEILLWAMCAYLGWTLISIPYTAWGAELSDHYHERTYFAGSREGFVIIGTVLGIILPVTTGIAGDPAAALALMTKVLWVSLPVCLALTLFFVPAAHKLPEPIGWAKSFELLKMNRPLRRLLGAYVLNGVANGLPATLFLLFVANILDARDSTGLFLGAYFLSGVVFLPAWILLSRRLGKHRTWAWSMLIASLVFMWVPFLGEGDLISYFIICVLTGMCIGADLALPASIQADVVELDSAAGGGNRAGLFFGIWGMATKIAAALAIGIAFPILDLTGFTPNAENTGGALLMLAILYGIIPVIFKLFAVSLVWHFPLDIAYHAQLKKMQNPFSEQELSDEDEDLNLGADAYGSSRLHRNES